MTHANWIPAELLGLFFAVGVLGRAWVHWRRYGASGLALFRGTRADDRFDAVIAIYALALAANVVLAGWRPAWLAWAALPGLCSPTVLASGATIGVISLILMVVAQLDMGASWRVGIDPDAKPGLVTSGVYRFSRNPIYACMLVALGALVLILPNVFSVALAIAGGLGVRVQVSREEDYLLRTYGEEFRSYRAHVHRFLPGLTFGPRTSA